MPHGTSEYARVKSALSVSRLVRYLPPANGTTLSTTVTGGAQLYVLEWTARGDEFPAEALQHDGLLGRGSDAAGRADRGDRRQLHNDQVLEVGRAPRRPRTPGRLDDLLLQGQKLRAALPYGLRARLGLPAVAW